MNCLFATVKAQVPQVSEATTYNYLSSFNMRMQRIWIFNNMSFSLFTVSLHTPWL